MQEADGAGLSIWGGRSTGVPQRSVFTRESASRRTRGGRCPVPLPRASGGRCPVPLSLQESRRTAPPPRRAQVDAHLDAHSVGAHPPRIRRETDGPSTAPRVDRAQVDAPRTTGSAHPGAQYKCNVRDDDQYDVFLLVLVRDGGGGGWQARGLRVAMRPP